MSIKYPYTVKEVTMKRMSRRDFLKASAMGMSAMTVSAFLNACEKALPTYTPLPELLTSTLGQPSTATSPKEESPTATETPPAPSDTPTPIPDMVVASGGEPEALVTRAMEALGGMGMFVPPGANVVIKPNMCVAFRTYEYAATTNPFVVGTLVKLALQAGAASVKVMDSPFNGTQQKAYETSGVREQVEAAGGEMVYMLSYKFVETKNPAGIFLKQTAVYDDILKADVVINVPIAKQHGSSRLTLGMKNLMGMILDRNILHVNLGQSIADLTALIKPKLTVLDAVRILTANGPTGGNLRDVKQLNTIVAGTDVVAVDSYASSFFDLKPEDLDYVMIGTAMGLGRSDLENLYIQTIKLDA